METYNTTPPADSTPKGGFNMNIVLKILGALAVIFLMFLPVAGCEGTNQYSVKGTDIIFKADRVTLSMLLFILSVSCGIAIIFFRKPLMFIIFGTAGIVSFLSAYFYEKSRTGMDVVELKIGAFLAIMAYMAVIVLAIVKKVTANNNSDPLIFPSQEIPPPPPPQQQQYTHQQYMPPVSPPPPPLQQQPLTRPKFCTKCGIKFPENYQGKFCSGCGAKVPGN